MVRPTRAHRHGGGVVAAPRRGEGDLGTITFEATTEVLAGEQRVGFSPMRIVDSYFSTLSLDQIRQVVAEVGHCSTEASTQPGTGDADDLYAGHDGKVYRREGGAWLKYEDGGWSRVHAPARQAAERIAQLERAARARQRM